jgi:hypothetical protein
MPVEVNVTPFKRKELAHSQTGAAAINTSVLSLSGSASINRRTSSEVTTMGIFLRFAPCRTSRIGFVSQIP